MQMMRLVQYNQSYQSRTSILGFLSLGKQTDKWQDSMLSWPYKKGEKCLVLICHFAREREREKTILRHVPSPTGLTRWNIQCIPQCKRLPGGPTGWLPHEMCMCVCVCANWYINILHTLLTRAHPFQVGSKPSMLLPEREKDAALHMHEQGACGLHDPTWPSKKLSCPSLTLDQYSG